jgi:hypothetical protein
MFNKIDNFMDAFNKRFPRSPKWVDLDDVRYGGELEYMNWLELEETKTDIFLSFLRWTYRFVLAMIIVVFFVVSFNIYNGHLVLDKPLMSCSDIVFPSVEETCFIYVDGLGVSDV